MNFYDGYLWFVDGSIIYEYVLLSLFYVFFVVVNINMLQLAHTILR